MGNLHLGIMALQLVVLLALYWTLWKMRAELVEGRQKLNSELADVKKKLSKEEVGK